MIDKQVKQHDPESSLLILESITDYAVLTTNEEGIITTWNSGAEKILLYRADEIIGHSGDILYTPEDIENEVPALELGTALTDGKAVDERFHVRKDRTRFWGSGLVFPLYNTEGKHIGFTKIMKNLTDEEQAEANIREENALADIIVNSYNECIVVLKTDLTIINVTPTFVELFSAVKENIIGKNLYEILDGGIKVEQFSKALDATLKGRDFYLSFEVELSHPDKGTRAIKVKPRRLYQAPNLLFSLEFVDLTDDRAVMEEKDVFISVASHEIRTPVSVIKAYSQILDRELKEAKPIVKQAVKKINEQVNFMSSLMTSLLDTTKIRLGKMVLNREVFNLCSLVKEQVDAFNLTQTTHQITIENEFDAIVNADKVRIASVILNLLSNAVKYSPAAREVVINVAMEKTGVKVSVQDFGLGIPTSEQRAIFQRFGRTQSVQRAKISGTGLGLHLSAEIIKLEGGTIGFITEEGKGSTFCFQLPLY
jgi:PAS domain S-box-containing protein